MLYVILYVILSLLAISTVQAADSKDSIPTKPCTVDSPSSGLHYDLNTITVPPLDDGKQLHKDSRNESWHAKGYDYGANFTLNFCAPVIEELDDVVGVKEELYRNVSAYYTLDGKTYSIGQNSSEPIFRGRKLVLNYTNGSPCDSTPMKRARKLLDDDDGKPDTDIRRKSTIISFLCEHDPLAPNKASLAFVGASPDDCTYFFEARSMAACGGRSEVQQSLGPGGVFGVIALIALVVYVLGGIAYQRTVMHQRGWRQLPNYALWAGMASFVKYIFIIATSSCTRLVFRQRGYNQLPTTNGRSRGSRSEDENRLIDQLDDDWDD